MSRHWRAPHTTFESRVEAALRAERRREVTLTALPLAAALAIIATLCVIAFGSTH